MGFASGNVSFRRFFLTGRHPSAWSDEWQEAVARHAFGSYGEASPDGVEVGWIVPTHLFDVDFSEPHRICLERFVYLAMRVDRTAPPASVLKSYRKMEEQAALEAGGREFLSKTERRLAKESADRRAQDEAKKGMYRRVSAYPLVLDLEDGVVYFSNLGTSATERLARLFADTFQATLAPATLDEVAFRAAHKLDVARGFEDASPSYFADPPPGAENGNGSAFAPGDRSFLGREFLSWLWHGIDENEGVFDVSRGQTVTLAIRKNMQLACMHDVTGRATITNDAPAASPEARAALRIGKQPTRIGLLMGTRSEDWSFALDATKWQVSGLVIPPSEEKDPTARLIDRFTRVREHALTLDGLLQSFLARRLGADWPGVSNGIKRWAAASKPTGGARMQLVGA